MSQLKIFGIFVGAIVGIIILMVVAAGLGFVGNGLSFASFKFWAPKQENVKREVFENTQSYVEGKNQDLAKYHHEWLIAKDPEEKGALEAIVRQQFTTIKPSSIQDPDLAQFLRDCMNK